MKKNNYLDVPEGRLLSLDFFRGLTMFLLIGDFSYLFTYLVKPEFNGTIIHFIGTQFHHHPWHGLHFWDLIQPFFMFIVGVAIPFSVANRTKKGETQSDLIKHAFKRSALMLLFGWGLYCIEPGHITLRFQNVLSQLSVTYLIAFLIVNFSFKKQLAISLFMIGITELLYRTFPVEGFNQPFVIEHNFGAYIDLIISGEILKSGWVSFNAIPTTAHTIWGVLAGKLLLSDKSANEKIKILIIAGLIGVVIGYALDSITPIIKRISTSSFVFVSGGWSILALAISYWLIDVKKYRSKVLIFAVVGMNPLFIYLFAHVGGADLLNKIVRPFTMGLFSWMGNIYAEIITASLVWFLLWYLCYWLYKKRIFIKL